MLRRAQQLARILNERGGDLGHCWLTFFQIIFFRLMQYLEQSMDEYNAITERGGGDGGGDGGGGASGGNDDSDDTGGFDIGGSPRRDMFSFTRVSGNAFSASHYTYSGPSVPDIDSQQAISDMLSSKTMSWDNGNSWTGLFGASLASNYVSPR